MLNRTLALLGLFGASTFALSQASPTASRVGDLKIGAGYVSAESDYGNRFTGFAVYGDFDFTHHLGVELAYHASSAPSPSPLYEHTYEAGLRYYRTYGRFIPYGRISVGRGVFNYPPCPGQANNQSCANLAWNIYSLGGGTDIRVLDWLYLRGDFEYQKWPGFRGEIQNGANVGPANGLTPELFTFGAAYHFR